MRTMFDSVDAAMLPFGADLYLGYVDGARSKNIEAVRARFPGAHIVTCTVLGGDADAQVGDVESGDMTPASCVGWVQRRRAAGGWPTIYTPRTEWPQVRDAFHGAGVVEPPYFIADATGHEHLLAGSVATQWGQDRFGNYDISAVAAVWPGVDEQQGDELVRSYSVVKIPPPDPHGLQLQAYNLDGQLLPAGFSATSSVTIKANDDGTPVRAIVQPVAYLDVLVLSFQGLDGGPAAQGLVGVILEHR